MRTHHRCPKCDGARFLVVERLGFVQKMYKGEDPYVADLPVAVLQQPSGGLFGGTDLVALGSYESWSCLACGLTELYARGLEEVVQSGAGRVVDGDEARSTS